MSKTKNKPWEVTPEQRVKICKSMKCLANIEVATAQHCPIDYNDICDLVSLKWELFHILGIEHKKNEEGHYSIYNELVLKSEDNGADT
jgi:hypothetical protein|tara:strand:+ start:27138 stop:27401 length:264 start_codon:yes stop_codon:yes gene_type:complete